jgi:hypothetical protein
LITTNTGCSVAASMARPSAVAPSHSRSPATSPAQKASAPRLPRPSTRATNAAVVGPGTAQATPSVTA